MQKTGPGRIRTTAFRNLKQMCIPTPYAPERLIQFEFIKNEAYEEVQAPGDESYEHRYLREKKSSTQLQ